MLGSVLQAALLVALVGFLLADWVLPDSEVNARKIKSQSRNQTSTLDTGQGLWLKDDSRVVHVASLLPNGYARDIEIYDLDAQGGLKAMIRAESAKPFDGGWELHRVSQTSLSAGEASSQEFEQLIYPGNLSHELLRVLLTEPRQMSSRDLYSYIKFLDENRLDAEVERLVFWQKIFAPLTIVIMCLLAFPFVLGSQRQSNTGQRLLIGILLGLSFAAVDQVLTQLGVRFGINALTVAVMPNLLFFALAVFMLVSKSGQGAGLSLFSRLLRR
jgi:lipopolysaccharide export system permease protein